MTETTRLIKWSLYQWTNQVQEAVLLQITTEPHWSQRWTWYLYVELKDLRIEHSFNTQCQIVTDVFKRHIEPQLLLRESLKWGAECRQLRAGRTEGERRVCLEWEPTKQLKPPQRLSRATKHQSELKYRGDIRRNSNRKYISPEAAGAVVYLKVGVHTGFCSIPTGFTAVDLGFIIIFETVSQWILN